MEIVACTVGGLALIGCAIALFKMSPPDWHADGDLVDSEHRALARWARVQRTVRLANNSLLAIIGLGILASSFVPRGQMWLFLWSAILLLLLVCIGFAMLDALSSVAGYRRALPEAARRSFSRTDATLGNDVEAKA